MIIFIFGIPTKTKQFVNPCHKISLIIKQKTRLLNNLYLWQLMAAPCLTNNSSPNYYTVDPDLYGYLSLS